jgi:fused signal recognition particle receptor
VRDAHFEALQLLVIFVGILIFAIATPFILKAFRKRKSKGTGQGAQPEDKQPASIDVAPRSLSADRIFRSDEDERELERIAFEETQAQNFEKSHLESPKFSEKSSKASVDLISEQPISLEEKLKNTKSSLWGRMRSVFDGKTESEALEEVEEILYTSDIGPKTVENLLEKIRFDLSSSALKNFETISKTLKHEMSLMMTPYHPSPVHWNSSGPTVILILGVNGVGKTTTIGKLAALWAGEGKKVLVAAGDTFRAAAASQLKVWSERAQVEIFAPEHTKDPSGVAFEAVQKGINDKIDVVIVDTAGRLHTQDHLMEELKKIKRVVGKALEGAPHEAWIVLDANSGQNALIQAKMFNEAIPLTGAVVTKMDGTAKGGIIVGLHDELKIPVKKIGVGEKIEDLRDFKPEEFLNAIL